MQIYLKYYTECTRTGQVSKRLLVLILWRLVWRQHSTKQQISLSVHWSDDLDPCSATPPRSQSSYCDVNWLRIEKVLGHHISAKIFSKGAWDKVQTMVPENRYRYKFEDGLFWAVIFITSCKTWNNVCVSFLVHQVYHILLLQSGGIAKCLRIWFPDYTYCPMIANVLYVCKYICTYVCVSVTLSLELAVRSTCTQTINISQHFVNAS